MIGDTVSDVLAGRNAGCRSVLVRTGYGAKYAHDPDWIDMDAADLAEATARILSEDAT